MGEVRTAHDRRLRRTVAVKTLRPDLTDQPGFVRRFEDEARIAAQLSHPHAVTVYDVGEHHGVPYLVMEQVEGTTLAAEIARGPIDPAAAVRIAGQILAAVGAAHAAGILHRDIKPGNVILTPEGMAKVTDFGIAKVVGEDATTRVDGTGGVLGTAAYLAPERLRGEPATVRSDLYSVGAVLYEALCGEAPFPADTPAGMVLAITSGTRVPLGYRRPDLPPALIAAVEAALAPRPEDRFPDAAAMAAALDESPAWVPEGPPVPPDEAPTIAVAAMPATEILTPPARPEPERRRPPWKAVAVAVVAILALLALAPDGDSAADPDAGDAAAPPAATGPGSGDTIWAAFGEMLDAAESTVVVPPAEGAETRPPGKGKGKKKKG